MLVSTNNVKQKIIKKYMDKSTIFNCGYRVRHTMKQTMLLVLGN